MPPVKGLENVSNIQGTDAQAAIFDGNPNFVSVLSGHRLRANMCPTALTIILNCIADQILQGPFQRGSVASNRWQVFLDHRFEIEMPFSYLCLARRQRPIDKVRRRYGTKLITLLSRLRARKLQNLLNHVRQTPAFPVDNIAVLRDLLWTVNNPIGKVLTR